MKRIVIGILAHVDAGKTTLSESMLYLSGKIKELGRVDKKNAYLDNYELERARGITIFSKQAIFEIEGIQINLLDTPGHVDFSAEMERTLQVLDYAILVISGADGIQSHTKTLWKLLSMYNIPTFLFINKMDQFGINKDEVMQEIKKQLGDNCIDFGEKNTEDFYEQLALCDENFMEIYFETGNIQLDYIKEGIKERKVFPCFFGSALKLIGIEEFMKGLVEHIIIPSYNSEFGAKIFKISRDNQGNRLTHMKITGGKLQVRDLLSNGDWEEKVNQIRIYSGEKFETVNEIDAGGVCAVVGLTNTKPGEGLGIEKSSKEPVLEPVLSYQLILPEDVDPRVMLPKLREIEEEEPELRVVWDEQLQEIQVQIMGEVQREILQSILKTRFGLNVSFDEGRIVYKETITNTVEGVGHFEPLRHYAEVHLLLEPSKLGSGLKFETNCSEDILSKNWQNLILNHLKEKQHIGVLTGSPITDMKITLISGRAHNKHTQGGDFREATYRAVRQGLKEAKSILLEPYYSFYIEIPEKMVGKVMNDIDKMKGTCKITNLDGEIAIIEGSAPVVNMRNYQKELASYTKGLGKIFCNLKGYEPCHNAKEIIEKIGYDSEKDFENPTGSVFCTKGSSFLVKWDKVKEYMHVQGMIKGEEDSLENTNYNKSQHLVEDTISLEEIDNIINRTYYSNQGRKSDWKQKRIVDYYKPTDYVHKQDKAKEEYLLVDGYNIIHAWPELKEIAEKDMDAARMSLLDILSNYQGIKKCEIIVVFDAYRVKGHREEIIDYHNIHIVFTKEAQTADEYIERFTYENKKKYKIKVATSDGLQQIIVRGAGSLLLSAKELKAEIDQLNEKIKDKYMRVNEKTHVLNDAMSKDISKKMKKHIKNLEHRNE